MASNDLRYGGDSESEDDFNPAPADLSDDENDRAPRISSPAADNHEDDEDEDARPSNGASKRPRHEADDDEDEEGGDAEGDEEQQHDEDEEEEDDDEDEDDVQGVRLEALVLTHPPIIRPIYLRPSSRLNTAQSQLLPMSPVSMYDF